MVRDTPPLVNELKANMHPRRSTKHSSIVDANTDQDNMHYAVQFYVGSIFPDAEFREDGWIVGPNGELLLWIPQEHCAALLRAKDRQLNAETHSFPDRDASTFVYGEDWAQCANPAFP